MKPIGDRLLVEPTERPDQSPGGLYIPEQARPKPVKGKVLEVGDEVTKVQKNDEVLYSMYGGIEIEGQDWSGDPEDTTVLLILVERDVLAVLNGRNF